MAGLRRLKHLLYLLHVQLQRSPYTFPLIKKDGKLSYYSGCMNLLKEWIFHDENWNHIINRWENRYLLSQGHKLSTRDNYQTATDEIIFHPTGVVQFAGQTTSYDEWLYLYLDPNVWAWRNFSWNMPICKQSDFKEFQFGFRYKDFYNRYRYRFQDNKICFDIIKNGCFYNNLSSIPFKMTLGKYYNLRIEAKENHFVCYIDEKLMLYNIDFHNYFPVGSVAIILWENNGFNNLRGLVGPIKIYSFNS